MILSTKTKENNKSVAKITETKNNTKPKGENNTKPTGMEKTNGEQKPNNDNKNMSNDQKEAVEPTTINPQEVSADDLYAKFLSIIQLCSRSEVFIASLSKLCFGEGKSNNFDMKITIPNGKKSHTLTVNYMNQYIETAMDHLNSVGCNKTQLNQSMEQYRPAVVVSETLGSLTMFLLASVAAEVAKKCGMNMEEIDLDILSKPNKYMLFNVDQFVMDLIYHMRSKSGELTAYTPQSIRGVQLSQVNARNTQQIFIPSAVEMSKLSPYLHFLMSFVHGRKIYTFVFKHMNKTNMVQTSILDALSQNKVITFKVGNQDDTEYILEPCTRTIYPIYMVFADIMGKIVDVVSNIKYDVATPPETSAIFNKEALVHELCKRLFIAMYSKFAFLDPENFPLEPDNNM